MQAIIKYKNRDLLIGVFASQGMTPSPISKMKPNIYLILGELDQAQELETALNVDGNELEYIGVWNDDGTINDYGNYTIQKYRDALNDVVEYDDNDEEISRKRPTLAQARLTQVNNIAGYPDRII